MKIAILGLPQSGKRTLFTLLTGRPIPDFRKEGEVIEGKAHIRDPRIDVLSKMYIPEKTTYATNEFMLCSDIALGSGDYSWLKETRTADLICLVVREFSSPDVFHPAGSVDAKRDRTNLEAELLLADMDLVEKRLERITKDLKRQKPTPAQLLEEQALKKAQAIFEKEQFLSTGTWTPEEMTAVRSLNFVTLKPILWCYNVDDDKILSGDGDFRISALIEKEIADLGSDDEKKDFLEGLGLSASGIDRLNASVYDKLGLMSFYTAGKDEVRAWTIKKGTSAPESGGKIHSDIERGFIRVEVIKYDDFVREGSEQAVKAKGLMKGKGRDYIMEDGDICHFLFNV